MITDTRPQRILEYPLVTNTAYSVMLCLPRHHTKNADMVKISEYIMLLASITSHFPIQ
jgi:hypothetical protein